MTDFARIFNYPAEFEVPDDIANLLIHILEEQYLPNSRPLFSYLPFHPFLIPASVRRTISTRIFQKRSSAAKTKKRTRTTFPNDFSDNTVDSILGYFSEGVRPEWPDGNEVAVVLSHDVDSSFLFNNPAVYERINKIEAKYDFRSAWYIVSNLYDLDFDFMDDMQRQGHEIGWHGDKHDYKLAYLPEEQMERRFERCRPFLDRYDVRGFRSPVFLRSPALMNVLRKYVKYDTSRHDTTRSSLSRRQEGCCTLFPYNLDNFVELPITIPEDIFLKAKGCPTKMIIEEQIRKIDIVQNAGGLIHILTHPEPHLSANEEGFEIYEKVLEAISGLSKKIWKTVPKDICSFCMKNA